jgi:hypothetical protein
MDPSRLVGEFDQSLASRKLNHYFDYTGDMDSDEDARGDFDYERVDGDLYFMPSDEKMDDSDEDTRGDFDYERVEVDEEMDSDEDARGDFGYKRVEGDLYFAPSGGEELSCRCEYPGEDIYLHNNDISFGRGSSARNFSPLGRRKPKYRTLLTGGRGPQSGGSTPAPTPPETAPDPCQVDTFKIVGDRTVLPSCHHACRGVQYVCPDEDNHCQLWTFDCASLPSTDARRLVVDDTRTLTKNRLNSARRQRKSKTSLFTSTGILSGEVGGDKRGLGGCNRPVVKLPEDHALCLTVDLDDRIDDCGPTVSQAPVYGGGKIDTDEVGFDEIEAQEYDFGFDGFREEANEDTFNFDGLYDDKSKIGGGGRGRPVEDLPKDRHRCDEPSESSSEGATDSPLPSSMPSSMPSNEPSTSPSSGPSVRPSSSPTSPTELDMDSRPDAKPTTAEPSDQPSLIPSGAPSERPAPTICVEDVQVVPLDLNSTSMDFAKVVYIPIGAERVTIELV